MQGFHLAPEHFDVLTVAGQDAIRFLQGQLTCDVENLAQGTATWGAACNNKGRVHATFLLVKQESMLILLFQRGVGELFANAMNKFLPFYKCKLDINPSDWHCLGLAGHDSTVLLQEYFGNLPDVLACTTSAQGFICTVDASTPQYLACTSTGSAGLLDEIRKKIPEASRGGWQAMGMQSGHFPFMPQDTERYTVQELHLDRHGYVSFSKGCYSGQEIVARMHYRGKPKKQLYLLETAIAGALEIEQGLDVLDTTGNILGHTLKLVVDADGHGLCGLVQLPIEFAESGSSLRTTNGTPLRWRPL
jgi:folate-binding protein YgfZ